MPLVSICIPTFNRDCLLRDTIESIVSQKTFADSDLVEIVVSDNCSTDSTQTVVKEFADRFPGKVWYHKTTENIGFDNFREALSVAHGRFRKLNNDTLLHEDGALDAIVSLARANESSRDILFFANGTLPNGRDDVVCRNLDEFIDVVSYYNTWIASYGLWDRDLDAAMRIFAETKITQIPQTFELLSSVARGRQVRVCNKRLFRSSIPKRKGGYNIAEVFGYNYLRLLSSLVGDGSLSRHVYENEKKKLIKHVNYYYFDIKREFAFDKTGYFKWMIPFYRWNLYFYLRLLSVVATIVNAWFLRSIIKKEKAGAVRTIVLFSRYRIFSYTSRRRQKNVDRSVKAM